jgi:hypothetical protein
MSRFWLGGLVLSAVLCSISGWGQVLGFNQMEGEKVDSEIALDRALKTSSLTFQGKPFHAVMEIGTTGTDYSGRIEIWWVEATKYRLMIQSPKFSQEKVVNGDHVSEKDQGDYFPRWLENFVLAVLDPVPMANNFRRSGGTLMIGPQITNSCLRRDDRPGGITDQLTWGIVCFSGSEPHLESVLTMNVSMEFKDWRKFDKKQIARTYNTDVLDYKPVLGQLTVLEEIKKLDENMFTVVDVTPADQRISTVFVSTLKEESLVEKAPVIEWPSVREGKTEGYMIVYARTDRTGQVRETAKHNSDQPGLESFGMEAALKYKFKPLVVDGVPRQMEMPLVLHFTSRLEDPLPILTVDQMKNQMMGCAVVALPPSTPKGTVVTIRVSVDESGKVTGMGPVKGGTGVDWFAAMSSLRSCKFHPYVVNGKATYYKGDVELGAP